MTGEHLFRGSMRDFVNELLDGYSFDWEETEAHARREAEWATQRGELELARNWGMVLEAVRKARAGRIIV